MLAQNQIRQKWMLASWARLPTYTVVYCGLFSGPSSFVFSWASSAKKKKSTHTDKHRKFKLKNYIVYKPRQHNQHEKRSSRTKLCSWHTSALESLAPNLVIFKEEQLTCLAIIYLFQLFNKNNSCIGQVTPLSKIKDITKNKKYIVFTESWRIHYTVKVVDLTTSLKPCRNAMVPKEFSITTDYFT